MSGGAVLNRSRVAGSSLVGQTQNREQHHADVRLDFLRFTKATPAPTTGLRLACRSVARKPQEVLYSSGSVVMTRKKARKNGHFFSPVKKEVKNRRAPRANAPGAGAGSPPACRGQMG